MVVLLPEITKARPEIAAKKLSLTLCWHNWNPITVATNPILEFDNKLQFVWANEDGHVGELSLEWLKRNSYSEQARKQRSKAQTSQVHVGQVTGLPPLFIFRKICAQSHSHILPSPGCGRGWELIFSTYNQVDPTNNNQIQ